MPKHRIIAINLPQYHPFKENNEWWGKGFTEWTNVTNAKPRFEGHYQPHLPTETGFYDLRLPEARTMQADMAKEAGIYGFCYYHYWFNGHQLMERPVNEIIKTGEPDFPFMLCWANENWARNWDGGFKDILIKQEYSKDDDIAHMKWLCENVFCDKRYIRINNKPFFIIYKPALLPSISETLQRWREVAAQYGLKLYIGYMRGEDIADEELMKYDFDVHVDFQPSNYEAYPIEFYQGYWSYLWYRIKYNWHRLILKKEYKFEAHVIDYYQYIENYKHREFPYQKYKEFPCISPSWDNSARRTNKPFWALINNTPQLFGEWLRWVINIFEPYSKEENFIFINAWNEWAEGNHLEPDIKWGNGFLNEIRNTMKENKKL